MQKRRRTCHYCGFENPAFAKSFCVKCGNTLPAKLPSASRLWAMVILVGLSLLAGVAVLTLHNDPQYGLPGELTIVGPKQILTCQGPTCSLVGVGELSIKHSPVTTGTIGTPLEIAAAVGGPVLNVTLAYATTGGTYYTRVLMKQMGVAGTSQYPVYQYTIPGSQVNGNLAYYVTAFDNLGNKVTTSTYQITISDFKIVAKNSEIVVYRNSTQQFTTQLDLLPINGFSQALTLSTGSTPQGLTVTFRRDPAQTSVGPAYMTISADQTTIPGTYAVTVLAAYAPEATSTPVTRQTTLAVTVADFDLGVTPTSRYVTAGSSTTFTLTLTFQKGFSDSVTFKLTGLPEGTKYLFTSSSVASVGGPGTTTITLQILTSTLTKLATYPVTITASGGGVTHSQVIQLVVSS